MNVDRTVSVELNQEITYKDTLTGQLLLSQNDVRCAGGARRFGKRFHNDVISLGTYTIIFKEVDLEYDIRSHVLKDLDALVEIDPTCLDKKACSDHSVAYALKAGHEYCPWVLLQSGQMERVTIPTTHASDIDGIIFREHKALFRIGTETPSFPACPEVGPIYSTNHPTVFLVLGEKSVEASGVFPPADGESVDLELEISSSEAFLEYRFIELLHKHLANMLESLCQLSMRAVSDLIMSPLHSDRFLQISGEILSELQCTRVTVTAKLGETRDRWCTKEMLPVYLDSKPKYLMANSRMVISDVPRMSGNCSTLERPIFISREGHLVTSEPTLRLANLKLDKKGLSIGDWYQNTSSDTLDDFGTSLLYDHSAMRQLNSLLHYGLTKQRVMGSMLDRYCSDGQCGGYKPTGDTSFSLTKLESSIEEEFEVGWKLYNTLVQLGSIASLLVVTLMSFYATRTVLKCLFPALTCTNCLRWCYKELVHREHGIHPALEMTSAPLYADLKPRAQVLHYEVIKENPANGKLINRLDYLRDETVTADQRRDTLPLNNDSEVVRLLQGAREADISLRHAGH